MIYLVYWKRKEKRNETGDQVRILFLITIYTMRRLHKNYKRFGGCLSPKRALKNLSTKITRGKKPVKWFDRQSKAGAQIDSKMAASKWIWESLFLKESETVSERWRKGCERERDSEWVSEKKLCVCVRERDRERERDRKKERDRNRQWVIEGEAGSEREREREREKER